MSLVNNYVELNKIAEEVIENIRIINENYLNNDIEYPYSDVENLLNKYDLKFKKISKRKNSLINRILNKISSKKRKLFDSLNAPNRYETLNISCERVVPQILDFFEENRLTDESRDLIKDKLFPVVKGLNLRSLLDLYKKCKKCERILHNGNALAYLQEMFVEYIISNILNDPARKGVKSGVVWTYKEICYNILDEDVLKIRRNAKK